jgi:ethanolamine utilization protein EutJ
MSAMTASVRTMPCLEDSQVQGYWKASHLEACAEALESSLAIRPWHRLTLGFDLGTTNLVIVALNEEGWPVSAVLEPSNSSIRDGVVVDYFGAMSGMERCLDLLKAKLGVESLEEFPAAAAFPPGISEKTARVCSNIVEALGFSCRGLYEEPSAAGTALGMPDCAVIDVGGGTTGIAVLREGSVVYSADEPTGGTHMSLVVAGSMKISFEEAEKIKRDPRNRKRLGPILKPVVEKMALIAREKLQESGSLGKMPVVLVGGGADVEGAEETMSSVLGQIVKLSPHPLLVTPCGIAMTLWREMNA